MPKKKVNINPQGRPLTSLGVIIRSNITGAELEVSDIKKLILEGARVVEVCDDGTLIPLNETTCMDMNYKKKFFEEQQKEQAIQKQKEIDEQNLTKIIAEKRKAAMDVQATIAKPTISEAQQKAIEKAKIAKAKAEEAKKVEEAKKELEDKNTKKK